MFHGTEQQVDNEIERRAEAANISTSTSNVQNTLKKTKPSDDRIIENSIDDTIKNDVSKNNAQFSREDMKSLIKKIPHGFSNTEKATRPITAMTNLTPCH